MDSGLPFHREPSNGALLPFKSFLWAYLKGLLDHLIVYEQYKYVYSNISHDSIFFSKGVWKITDSLACLEKKLTFMYLLYLNNKKKAYRSDS